MREAATRVRRQAGDAGSRRMTESRQKAVTARSRRRACRPVTAASGGTREWPLWEVFVRRPARTVAPARRLPARARRRDGAAQRPRPLHPPQRGRLHLGRARRRDHRVQPGREGRVLRPGRRQGLPAPHVLRGPGRGASTCDDRDRPDADAALAATRSASATTRSCSRTGCGEWITNAPAARGGRRPGQHRPGPARPGPHAADLRRRGRGGRAAPRTTSPTCATSASSATCSSSSCRTATSRSRWPACWCSRPTSSRCTRRCAQRRRHARGDRRQGRQGGRLPPRPRHQLGAAPRRRHRAAHARMQAGAGASGRTSRSCSTPPGSRPR